MMLSVPSSKLATSRTIRVAGPPASCSRRDSRPLPVVVDFLGDGGRGDAGLATEPQTPLRIDKSLVAAVEQVRFAADQGAEAGVGEIFPLGKHGLGLGVVGFAGHESTLLGLVVAAPDGVIVAPSMGEAVATWEREDFDPERTELHQGLVVVPGRAKAAMSRPIRPLRVG